MESFFNSPMTLSGQALWQRMCLFADEVSMGEDAGFDWTKAYWLVGTAAVLVLPFVVGNFFARNLRMPTYNTRIGVVLLAIAAAVCVLLFGELKYGVDIRGGTILVYEMNPEATRERARAGESRITAEAMVPSLKKRIDPAGTSEIVVRPYGEEQIEIIIPEVNQQEVNRIKGIIEKAGILTFAIVANGRDDGDLIRRGTEQSKLPNVNERMARTVVDGRGEAIGFWATVDREQKPGRSGIRPLRVAVSDATVRDRSTGRLLDIPAAVAADPEATSEYLQREGIQEIQVLMAHRPGMKVTGEDLAMASRGVDNDGSPAVNFRMDGPGSKVFYRLTLENRPEGNFRRRLGIVLDDELLSAPSINSPISGAGIISGRFTSDEVKRLVDILQAGQLPAALTPQPIAENQIGSTLGADTIEKGIAAIITSLLFVLIFIVFYYRFIGLIACIALLLNLAMTVAVMILINQPISLPGLAGLVLTVGMSVDANVLIFERIREELKKGSATRMAIRNGFGRATTTIVDANLTTLITAIVLYAIGTDQIRGFAVTLILGIIFSMFTAIYVSRTFFDISERKGFLSLSMSDLINSLRGDGPPFDFIKTGRVLLFLSFALVVCGLIAIYARGRSILDIDFAGGSSVTFQLVQPADAVAVREFVDRALNPGEEDRNQFTLNSVTIASLGDDANRLVYKIDTDIEDVNVVKAKLRALNQKVDADEAVRLVTYAAEVSGGSEDTGSATDNQAPAVEDQSHWQPQSNRWFVASRTQDEAPEEGQQPSEQTAATAEPSDADAPQPETAAAEANVDDTPVETTGPGDQPQRPPVGVRAPEEQEDEDKRFFATIRIGSAEQTDAETTDAADDTTSVQASVLRDLILESAQRLGITLADTSISLQPIGAPSDTEQWTPDSALRFSQWSVTLNTDMPSGLTIMQQVKQSIAGDPVWISSSSIGKRVAGDMVWRAVRAMLASLICVIGYIWFRFQRVMYGFAAVVALVHDVIITLGAIAVSFWLADYLGFLQIEQFKISLTVVAALLTIVGYSLNDTIVVFDRIRETKGKSPRLTQDMVNFSISQTLGRTLLTSITTLIVVSILYFFGGEGIHAFAFALVVGVMIGTYSSVFVASPLLLWMLERGEASAET